MIIYSQSQSHYESAKSKLKAGDLCFIGDEKKIIFHKNAKGEGAVVYEGTDTDTNTEVVKYIKAAVGIANTLDYDLSDYISSENSFIVRNIYKKPASDLTGDTISTDANSILFVNTCPKDDNLHYYNAILFTHNGSIYTGKTNKTNLKDLQGNLKRLAFYSELSDYSLATHTHD
jgi:glycyl-tRNA synthetase (class II)